MTTPVTNSSVDTLKYLIFHFLQFYKIKDSFHPQVMGLVQKLDVQNDLLIEPGIFEEKYIAVISFFVYTVTILDR